MKPVMTITFGDTADDIRIEALNTPGPSCLKLTQPIEEAIGKSATRSYKPELTASAQQPLAQPAKVQS